MERGYNTVSKTPTIHSERLSRKLGKFPDVADLQKFSKSTLRTHPESQKRTST